MQKGGRGRGRRSDCSTTNQSIPQRPNGPVNGFIRRSQHSELSENPSSSSVDYVAENVSTLSLHSAEQIPRTLSQRKCMLAPRLHPAKAAVDNQTVSTNIYPIEIEERIVYRYAVEMKGCAVEYLNNEKERGDVTKQKGEFDLTRGKRDSQRARKCAELMRITLRKFMNKNREFGYAYDLSRSLFTNGPLDLDEVSPFEIFSNDYLELRELMDRNYRIIVTIRTSDKYPPTFSTKDITKSISPDLLAQDHSLRQFYEIMTNQYGVESGSYFPFGCGRLYWKNSMFELVPGMKLLQGADKGVRFIEGDKKTGIVPALVLDAKKAPFFDEMPLMSFIGRIPELGSTNFREVRNNIWKAIEHFRLRSDHSSLPFFATGLSNEPVRRLKKGDMPLVEAYERMQIKIRSDLPAVVYHSLVFPFETLCISCGQKVPNFKLQQTQRDNIIQNAVLKPMKRREEIGVHMRELNLDGMAINPSLAAFGVQIGLEPIQLQAIRRMLPQVFYRNEVANVNEEGRWQSIRRPFLRGARIDNFFLFYDWSCKQEVMRKFFSELCCFARKKGIYFGKTIMERVDLNDLEKSIENAIRPVKNKNNFFMYVDNNEGSHGTLKLCEVKFKVVTQHLKYSTAKSPKYENIVSKMNAKNFGHNYRVVPEHYAEKKWLSSGETLVIGYDVSHPPPHNQRYDRRLQSSENSEPSVVGISYNAADNPETFIGDYAFHEPHREQVDSSVLQNRTFRILQLFCKVRKLPKLIFITRDGVSEGQHRMVIEEELEAIRAGIKKYLQTGTSSEKYTPKIVLVIVTKRHNKRFFKRDKGKLIEDNCLPGTVIDHTVTRVDATEIFMQSHKVLKGTGKIPSYTLLVNEANMEMEELQAFLMALCYHHQITASAISLPEPVYQADEWAKRGRSIIRAWKESGHRYTYKEDGTVDWDAITRALCYEGSRLEKTRLNA